MKIGFLTSKRAEKEFQAEFRAMVVYLEKKGNEVIHGLDTSLEKILPMDYLTRQDYFMKFYAQLEDCDLVFAECTLQSTQVGYGLAQLRLKGKPVVALTQGSTTNQFFPKGEVDSNVENMMVYTYTKDTMLQTIDDALVYMEPHIEKRFTIIFPSHLLAKVEEKSRKLSLPKSVYIRQLIEKDVTTQESSDK